MKLATYFLTSLLAVVAMVIFAMYTREQFYPVILFLVSSKVSFIINVNMIVAIFVSSTAFVNKIFLGNLRDVEVEMLIDKGKYALTETCLAFTIFRNEFSYPTISLFIFLLCVKSFHWLCKARIDYLDQVMPASKWIYFKIGLFLSLLLALDIWTAYSCIIFTMKHGRSASILFGFEFGLLCISALNISTRFLLLVFDQHLTHGVILKGFFVMIVDLICDGLRAVTYTCFFALVFSHYGLPIHIMREVFMAFQIFQRRLISFWKYLKLSRNLEHALPAATEEEIRSAGDCLICRDAMTSGKKLPCSHVFHMDCLRMWLQHQQSCPLCRSDIPTNIPAARSQNTPVVAAGDAANVNIQNPVNIQNVGPMVVQRGLNAYARRRLPGEIAAPVPPPTAPPAVPPAVQTPLDESLSATSTIPSSEPVEADSTVPLTPADVQKQRVLYFQQKSMESATSSASTSVSVESPSTNTESLTMKQSAEVKISSLASDRFPEGFHSHLYEGTSAFNQSDGIVESKSDPTILPSFFYIAHGDTTQLLESGAPATSAASSATAASNGFTHLVVSKESSVGSEVVRYIKKVSFSSLLSILYSRNIYKLITHIIIYIPIFILFLLIICIHRFYRGSLSLHSPATLTLLETRGCV